MKKKQAFYRWIFKFVALHDVDAQILKLLKYYLLMEQLHLLPFPSFKMSSPLCAVSTFAH